MKEVQPPGRSPNKTGRPLSFDRDAALERAMLTFWQNGYETTSITDLTGAMGISTPSLYGSFGDKKRLFLEAVELYAGDLESLGEGIASAPTALDAAREMLKGAVIAYTGETTPPGCLLASATASGSAGSAEVQRAVANIRTLVMSHLRQRIERDIALGIIPRRTDASALAALVMTVMQGMSVLARDGVDRPALQAIAITALQAWPRAENH